MTELNRYKNGKIYKIEPIVDHNEEDIYIGSSTQYYLSTRMNQHKGLYKINKKQCNVKLLFDKYGVENCNIILIESVEANNKMELHQREAHYIKTLKCVNKLIPLRTDKEYRENNKEKDKEYRKKNKLQKQEYDTKYYEDNKNIILEKCKEYREINKDKIKEHKKEYYEANKDAINARRRELRKENKM